MTENTKSFLTLFLAISAMAISSDVFSQKTAAMHFPKVTFGEIDGTATTKEKVLASPRLICHEPNCEVRGFTFMILRQDRDIIGPYHINGAQLTEKLVSTLKELPGSIITKIFIDSIRVNYVGKKMQVPGIAFQYDH
jgi:hypothetical protein